MARTRVLYSVLAWLWLSLLPAPASFNFNQPPGLVNLSSAKRNHVFYVGEAPAFTLDKAATRYEVRNYYGTLVASGATTGSGLKITLSAALPPGWYKLYLYGATDQGGVFGYIVGGTNFVIFRNDANFPALPAVGTVGSSNTTGDEIIRGLTGMGPQRLRVEDAANPDAAIALLQTDIALDKTWYLGRDPLRKRALLITFPNGTTSTDGKKIAGVKKVVAAFKNDVVYWEGRNEPQDTAAATYATEYLEFYDAVKAVSPTAKVLGPAIVSVTVPARVAWLHSFFNLIGTKIDGFSFHAYNVINGDVALARHAMEDLQAILAAHNLSGLEKWQTEQGYFCAYYGIYSPRHQGQWTMMQMMMHEQYGLPKEHNHLWYDVSHGFWDQPTFWENADTSLNPAAALLRVWSEELYGTNFSRTYDFGTEQNVAVGSLFTGSGKSIAAFMAAGTPATTITLAVSGSSVHTVSPFGVAADLQVTGGVVKLPIGELPSYVELATGQTCEVIARTYGENVARRSGVSLLINGAADSTAAKLVNGSLENSYYSSATAPWRLAASASGALPVTVELTLPAAETVSDVLLYAAAPWQFDGTLLNYDLQYWNGTAWVTLEHVTEPVNTLAVDSPTVACVVDSYFSDRCIFEHHFAPVTTSRLRLLINDVTYGGNPDVLCYNNFGAFTKAVVLREIEVYKATGPAITSTAQTLTPAPGASATLQVTTSSTAGVTYVWKKNGVVIAGATAATLTLSSVTLDSQGAYTVTATNSTGSSSQTSRVVLNTPFNTWAASYFSSDQLNRPRELLAADAAGLGYSTLHQYFFGIDPRAGLSREAVASLPLAGTELVGTTRYHTLRFRKSPGATELTWSVEGATSMNGPWATVTPASTVTSAADSTGRVPVLLRFPTATARYLRLKLVLP